MRIQLVAEAVADIRAQWLILGVFEDEPGPPRGLEGTGLAATIERLRGTKDLAGGHAELTSLYEATGVSAGSVLVLGLGRRERFDAGLAFSAAVAASRRLAGKAREAVALVLPEAEDRLSVARSMTEGMIVGTRGPGLRLTEPNRHPFESLSIVVPPDRDEAERRSLERALRRGEVTGRAVNLARDLANTPPAEKSPSRLAERIRVVAEDAGLAVEVWDADRIERERFGGLIGVAAGSDQPPRFVVLRHQGGAPDAPQLALVGKGVTFDSGGLSLKPSASMEDMKADMTGAAVVAATLQAAARLKVPANLVGYLALTENMTGGRAMKLGDVLTMRNGKTVEVLNTDAEGRLILADALCYAVEQRPSRLIDLATLTGACMVALGTRIAGLFANDEELARKFLEGCRLSGERAWRMPLDDDFKELLKSQVADLKNIGGKWGGAVTAAKFLQQFVGETPWIHLDIAGPSWADSESATRDAGATGCFVRTLVRFAERLG